MDRAAQPIIIVDPRKEQTKGKETLSMNITAAKAVASAERLVGHGNLSCYESLFSGLMGNTITKRVPRSITLWKVTSPPI